MFDKVTVRNNSAYAVQCISSDEYYCFQFPVW